MNDRDSEKDSAVGLFISRRLSKLCVSVKEAVNSQNMCRLEDIARGVQRSRLLERLITAAPFVLKSSDMCIAALFLASAVAKVADGDCKDKFIRQLLAADGAVFLLAASRMYVEVDEVTSEALATLAVLMEFADCRDSSDGESAKAAAVTMSSTISSPTKGRSAVSVGTVVHQVLVHGGTTLLCRFFIYFVSGTVAERVNEAIL